MHFFRIGFIFNCFCHSLIIVSHGSKDIYKSTFFTCTIPGCCSSMVTLRGNDGGNPNTMCTASPTTVALSITRNDIFVPLNKSGGKSLTTHVSWNTDSSILTDEQHFVLNSWWNCENSTCTHTHKLGSSLRFDNVVTLFTLITVTFSSLVATP